MTNLKFCENENTVQQAHRNQVIKSEDWSRIQSDLHRAQHLGKGKRTNKNAEPW